MKKIFNVLILISLLISLHSCDDDNNSIVADGSKPNAEIVVTQQTNIKYGDKLYITGSLTDTRNLEKYIVSLKDKDNNILAQKYQMLLGQSFQMNEQLLIPLPQNATTKNLDVEINIYNSRKGIETKTFELANVQVPEFEKLYLILGNNSVITMNKNGEVFEAEETFPAGIKGIISTTTSKNGIYWGMDNGVIQSMAKDSLVIGSDVDASCKVSFNPKTFELNFGERHFWEALPENDCLYILGTISGHWQDGEINTEKAKMKMTGYKSDTQKYYTWTPPQGGNPETGMWGSTAAGTFRIKKGGEEKYILWDGKQIIMSNTDDKSKSFPITAGANFEFKISFEGEQCTQVQITSPTRLLEFTNQGVKINGTVMGESVDFANNSLKKKEGTDYIYESTISLTQKQQITSTSLNLATFAVNSDLFSGKGNSSWTLEAYSGTYIIRVDAFSGAFYACPQEGYPNFLYMNGWSWAASETSNPVTWDNSQALPLVKVSDYIYEATFYVFAWGGDVAFNVKQPTGSANLLLPNTNFTGSFVNSVPNSFLLPTGAGYYKVRIDLKDGITIGNDNTITPNSSKKFTIDYLPM